MSAHRPLVLAQVVKIHGTQVFYPCCDSCYSKLHTDSQHNRLLCLKCGNVCPAEQPTHRYRLSLTVTDGQADADVCVFGRNLEPFFGAPANDFASYVQHTESRLSAVCLDKLISQSLSHTFDGQMFIFGFKTKIPARGDSRSNDPVSLQAVIDCCLSRSGSEVTQTGHPGVKDSSLVAWQMTRANSEQQIQPVARVLQALVWRCEKAEDMSLGTVAEESADSLIVLYNQDSSSPLPSSCGSRSFDVGAGQRTLELSCDTTTRCERHDASDNTDSPSNDKSMLPHVAVDVSIERQRADTSLVATDHSKHCISFDKDAKICEEDDDDEPEDALTGSVCSTFSVLPALPVRLELDDDALHVSDIDFDETVDFDSVQVADVECWPGERNDLVEKEITDDTSEKIAESVEIECQSDCNQATNVVGNVIVPGGEYVNEGVESAEVACTGDPDETLDLAHNGTSADEHTAGGVMCDQSNHRAGTIPVNEATFTNLDDTEYLAQYKRAMGNTQGLSHFMGGTDELNQQDLSSCSDDDSFLLLACDAKSCTDRPPKSGEGSQAYTQFKEIQIAAKLSVGTCSDSDANVHDVCEDGDSVNDEWQDMPESEDLSAYLRQVDVQSEAADHASGACGGPGQVSCKEYARKPSEESEDPGSDIPAGEHTKPDAGVIEHAIESAQVPTSVSLPQQSVFPADVVVADHAHLPPVDRSLSTDPVPVGGIQDPAEIGSFSRLCEEEYFPESEDLDAYLQQLSIPQLQVSAASRETSQVAKLGVLDLDMLEGATDACIHIHYAEENKSDEKGSLPVACCRLDTGGTSTWENTSDVERVDPVAEPGTHSSSNVQYSSKQPLQDSLTAEDCASPGSSPSQHSSPVLRRSPTKFTLRQFGESPEEVDGNTRDAACRRRSCVSYSDLEGSADLFDDDYDDDDDNLLGDSDVCACSSSGSDSVFSEGVYEHQINVSERRRVTHVSASVSSLPYDLKQPGVEEEEYEDVATKKRKDDRRPSVWFARRLSTVQIIGDIDMQMLTTPSPEPRALGKTRSCLRKSSNLLTPLFLPHKIDVESQDLFCSPVGCDSPQQQLMMMKQDGCQYESTPVITREGSDTSPSIYKNVDSDDEEQQHGDSSLFSEDSSIIPPSCPRRLKVYSHQLSLQVPPLPVFGSKAGRSNTFHGRMDSPDLFSESYESARSGDVSGSLVECDFDAMNQVTGSGYTKDRPFHEETVVTGRSNQLRPGVGRMPADDNISLVLQSQDMFGDSATSSDSMLGNSLILA